MCMVGVLPSCVMHLVRHLHSLPAVVAAAAAAATAAAAAASELDLQALLLLVGDRRAAPLVDGGVRLSW